MYNIEPTLLVTGAAGHLGGLVVSTLLESLPAGRLRVLVRKSAAVSEFAARGVDVREGDYDQPETLDAALADVGRVLLISSSEVGRRVPQHRNVIEAAKRARVELLAYTSILHAETSTLALASEHLATEIALRESGIPFALLRNGWYFENATAAVPSMLAQGAAFGASGNGRISSAARADYAAAAAVVLASPSDERDRVYELAGDAGYTKAELAAEVTRQSGIAVTYRNLSEADYAAALVRVGLPAGVASLVADSDAKAASGELFDDSHVLAKLIGRATTTLAAAVSTALVPAETHG